MSKDYYFRINRNWAEFWQNTPRRREFLFSLSLLTTIMLGMLKYLQYNESRPGVQVADPLLALFPPIDLSPLTFFLLY